MLALDIGTSSLKAVVYAKNGRQIALESSGYEIISTQPGWAEANVEEWRKALDIVLSRLVEKSHLLEEIKAIAFTGQMHTAVLLDEKCEPISPTILWLDRRAAAETEELQALWKLPAHQLNSTYTLPKLLWLKRHSPEVIRRTKHILWPKDYLRFLLTGKIMTDITEAGGAGLLDWNTMLWAKERLEYLDIDPDILPPMLQPDGVAGALIPEIAKQYRINPLAKIIVGAGDVLALISSAPPELGRVSCSIGSSSMVFVPVDADQQINDPLNRVYTYPLLKYPLIGGVSSTTGAALKWACENLYPEISFNEVIDKALSVPEGSGGVLFLPFLSGERSPYWNDKLKGGFYGLTLLSNRPMMVRAVMEGVGYSLKYLIDIFTSLGVIVKEIALAGGGATVKGWPQILADICQKPVCIYSSQETVTHALFAYACKALGDERTFDQAILQSFEKFERIDPNPDLNNTYQIIYERYSKIADFMHNHIG